MTLINIISALGNNNSVYPLFVRDCCIENVAKVAMTYNQNAKDSKFIAKQATRERIIDEYGSSLVWLFGIPVIEKVMDKYIKAKKFSPNIDLSLFKEETGQGIETNIKKFKNIAPDIVEELKKVKNNKKAYQFLLTQKFLVATTIPVILMGYLLPKLNFAYTKKKLEKAKENNNNSVISDMINFTSRKNQTISFGSGMVETLSTLNPVQKMMILDGGLTIGRVGTARNKNEKAEMAFKMAGMCYLNYIAPKKIAKFLDFLTEKMFKINMSLDLKLLNDDKFLSWVEQYAKKLPKLEDSNTALEFIDNNITGEFARAAKTSGIITTLENGIRDPRRYVDTDKLIELQNQIIDFAKNAELKGGIKKLARQATVAKSFNILANIGISSALLALALPKAQFLFRRIITGSNLDPGIIETDKKYL